MDRWEKAGRPEREPSAKKSSGKKGSTPNNTSRKRTFSSDVDTQNDDPNIAEIVTPTSTKRKALIEIDDLEDELLEKEKSWIIHSAEKAANENISSISSRLKLIR